MGPERSPCPHGVWLPPQDRAALRSRSDCSSCRCSPRRRRSPQPSSRRATTGYHTLQRGRPPRSPRSPRRTRASSSASRSGRATTGRELWAAKISDNVAVDEDEPEVLFDGGTHADEHMGVEMTLKILHWLADGYGIDPRITSIVDTREIWIVFMVNPDGVAHDIAGGKFHYWRKNRQPTPGSTVDRHGPQPELRLPVGRRRPDELEPEGHHLPRPEGLLRTRDPRDARLPGQPRRSAAGSRSARRSRSTRAAGSSCGRTATP